MSRIVVVSLCYDSRDLPQIANQGTYRWENSGWMAHFCDALETLGHSVVAFPDVRYSYMLGEEKTNEDFYHLMTGFSPHKLIIYKGDNIRYSTLLDLQRKLPKTEWIWFSVDDPHLLHHQGMSSKMRMQLCTKALTCCVSSMQDYIDLGIEPILFYPTIDPKVQNTQEQLGYKLSEEDKERYSCDIMVGGTCYNEQHNSRARLCQSLIEAGMGDGLKLWGHSHWADSNWTHGIDLSPYYMGREKEQNMPKIYHNSKIVLNSWVNGGWPSGKQKCGYPTVGYYNWRYFEIMGSGSFQLCEWQESMKEWPYESGKHLQTWKTHDELVEKAKYYLEHEEERREIAKNGYELTHSKFVFEKNLEEIFGKVKNV
jgi:hypothetical protein